MAITGWVDPVLGFLFLLLGHHLDHRQGGHLCGVTLDGEPMIVIIVLDHLIVGIAHPQGGLLVVEDPYGVEFAFVLLKLVDGPVIGLES